MKWPAQLTAPVFADDNTRIAKRQSAMTRNGRVPTLEEVRESFAREYAQARGDDVPSESDYREAGEFKYGAACGAD